MFFGFLDELRAEFDRARTMKDEKGVLTRLWKRLGDIRYMDPFIIRNFDVSRDARTVCHDPIQSVKVSA